MAIVEIAQQALGHPVTVLHDVKAAAFGELVAGAGIGQADAAYLNLGTGVSIAFVFGWQVHQGSTGTAGEIGHVVVEPDGELCNCGRRGCLETVASGPAIARAAGRARTAVSRRSPRPPGRRRTRAIDAFAGPPSTSAACWPTS